MSRQRKQVPGVDPRLLIKDAAKLMPQSSRRLFLRGAASLGALATLTGCDIIDGPTSESALRVISNFNDWVQARLFSETTLAPEYPESDIAPQFRANGSTSPSDPAYRALAGANFVDWQLAVDGLVERPTKFSLADLRALPASTQVTRHDCVEGWSCIGKWTGTPLSEVLNRAGVKPQAKYVLFHCADRFNAAGYPDDYQPGNPDSIAKGGEHYYETIDFVDAYHPQTLLSYELNGQTLPIANGAPLRLRLGRQLGYKQAKYVMRIELVNSFARFGSGKGGYWEDQGYQWYGGI